MKRLSILVLALLLLSACAKKASAEETAEIREDTWGLTLSLRFEDEGKKLVFTRTDALEGDLQTGSSYVIETKKGDTWEAVPYREDFGEDLVWTAEARLIPVGESEFPLDWSFLYGELPVGEYRVGKDVMHFRAPGDFDTAMYYAEFAIVG